MSARIIIFGATGHIGQGVLIECLESPDVSTVLVVGRRSCGKSDPKLREILHDDFLDFSAIEDELTDLNACLFCLGISSIGMSEDDYHRITHDFAVATAEVLLRQNPEMIFCFVSGAGADDTLRSRMMWDRVKGKAENSLKAMPFKAVYIFRPAYVQPVKGVKTTYRMYRILRHFYPLLKLFGPKYVITTEDMGQAMLNAALIGSDKQVLENRDIKELAKSN
jgi:uncharacterized protein YbjT (DUF2867 family)